MHTRIRIKHNPFDTSGHVTNIDLPVSDIATHKINGIVNFVVLRNFNINIRGNYLSSRKDEIETSSPNNKLLFSGYFISNATISANNFIKGATLQVGCNNILIKHIIALEYVLQAAFGHPIKLCKWEETFFSS
jgi:outer membrane receptor for ferrienterochelin and colicin